MDTRTARREFRKLAKALKGKKKKNGDKGDLVDAISLAYTERSLAKFIVKEGLVNKLAKSRVS